ncbi:MAG: hypothetical protein KJ721_01745, partial [Nanoarchaeota archaeon]|nr:hypothetical protein [Nanoarchaeota archaeon]
LEIFRNKEDYPPKQFHLEKGINLLNIFEKLVTRGDILEDWETRHAYYKLLREFVDYRNEYEPVRTLTKIRKDKSTIQKIIKNENPSKKSLKLAREFFNEISDICLSLSNWNRGHCYAFAS